MTFRYLAIVVCDICARELTPHASEEGAREEAEQLGWTVVDYAVVCTYGDPTHAAFTDGLHMLAARLDQPIH